MGKDPQSYRPKGSITDRLLKLFGKDDPAWNPPRQSPAPSKESKAKASGWSTGEGKNRGKLHGRGSNKGKKK